MKIICAAEDPLAAISKGGSARVHSVYKNTVNLMAGESLISLQSSTVPMTPMALRTDISGETLQSLFEVGDTVHLSEKGIEAKNISIPMSRSLTTYSGALPLGTGHPIKKDLANLLSRCLAVAGKDSIFSGSEHLGGIETAAAEAAAEILRRAKADPMVLQELLGLGIGLTPSGDDFIIGVLAALFVALLGLDGAIHLALLGFDVGRQAARRVLIEPGDGQEHARDGNDDQQDGGQFLCHLHIARPPYFFGFALRSVMMTFRIIEHTMMMANSTTDEAEAMLKL